MIRISWLGKRAKQILQKEGLIPPVKRGFPFVARLVSRYICQYWTRYLVEDDLLVDKSEVDFLPRIQKFTFRMVSTNAEADELEKEGLEFRSQIINAKESLDKGAIAFCIFVGQELASISWAAMTQQAKDALEKMPYRVDFPNGEACHEGLWTNPKYRGMGLAPYGAFKRLQFMRDSGKVVARGSVAKSNISSRQAATKHDTKYYAEARYLKILWWKWCKEKPLEQPNVHP